MRPCDSVAGTSLHAVRAALVLEAAEGAVAADLERIRAVGGVQRLGPEAEPLRVAGEHAVHVTRPQARLVAAGAPISTITFLSSFGSGSTMARRISSSSSSIRSRVARSSSRSSASSAPSSISSCAPSVSETARRHSSASLAAGRAS